MLGKLDAFLGKGKLHEVENLREAVIAVRKARVYEQTNINIGARCIYEHSSLVKRSGRTARWEEAPDEIQGFFLMLSKRGFPSVHIGMTGALHTCAVGRYCKETDLTTWLVKDGKWSSYPHLLLTYDQAQSLLLDAEREWVLNNGIPTMPDLSLV